MSARDGISPEDVRRLDQIARQSRHNSAPQPPPVVTAAELKKWLVRYCQAWSDLQSELKTEIELFNFDTGNQTTFRWRNLPALEQQIDRIRQMLGRPVIVRGSRPWA